MRDSVGSFVRDKSAFRSSAAEGRIRGGVDAVLPIFGRGRSAFALRVLFWAGLRTTRSEAGVLFFVGVLFAVSSLALYESFKLMPAGIASAILFLYPVFTALIMGVFFKAPIGWRATAAIAVSFCGILLLADLRGGSVSALGIGLVVLSVILLALPERKNLQNSRILRNS